MYSNLTAGTRSPLFNAALQFIEEMRARPGFPEGKPVFLAGLSQGGFITLVAGSRVASTPSLADLTLGGLLAISPAVGLDPVFFPPVRAGARPTPQHRPRHSTPPRSPTAHRRPWCG